jgi:hypothetical protein
LVKKQEKEGRMKERETCIGRHVALFGWDWEGWDGCMHGIGIGQESKVKRTKLGRRTGFSMTFMSIGFFASGVDICLKPICAYI